MSADENRITIAENAFDWVCVRYSFHDQPSSSAGLVEVRDMLSYRKCQVWNSLGLLTVAVSDSNDAAHVALRACR